MNIVPLSRIFHANFKDNMILDLFDFDCSNFQSWLQRRFNWNVSIEHLETTVDFIILILIVLFTVKYGRSIWNWIKNKRTIHNTWRKKYIKDHLDPAFIGYNTKESRKRYIQTRIQNEAPSNYEELEKSNANSISSKFIEKFLGSILIESNSERLYCILADSGMGKSTALVNLFISYIQKYKRSTIPFEIRILSLSDDDVLDRIDKLDNQANTILLLDALDENIEAVENHQEFLMKLETASRTFRFVVITCRTQFFPSEQEQIKESKIIKVDGGKKGFASYNTFYVSPFNDMEIAEYLDRVFGKRNFRKSTRERRRKADDIIKNPKCKSLLVRPMILAHIEQLADENRNYHMAIDIYDAMVDYWLNREVGRMEPTSRETHKELLRKLSAELAQDIFNNRAERRGYYIPKDDLETFLEERGHSNDTLHIRERSLLNRDGGGLVKFSHKSFLEYFLAQNYFNDCSALDDFSGMDFTRELYRELCTKYIYEFGRYDNNMIYPRRDRNRIIRHIQIKQKGSRKVLSNDREQMMVFRTIVIEKIGSFNLRYLEELHADKLYLSKDVSPNVFNEAYDWMSNISAIEIEANNKITNLNVIRKFPNLKYLFVTGNTGMSNERLINQVKKSHPGITLVLNDRCLIHDGNVDNSDPMSLILKINMLTEENREMMFERHIELYKSLYELSDYNLDQIKEKIEEA